MGAAEPRGCRPLSQLVSNVLVENRKRLYSAQYKVPLGVYIYLYIYIYRG